MAIAVTCLLIVTGLYSNWALRADPGSTPQLILASLALLFAVCTVGAVRHGIRYGRFGAADDDLQQGD